MKLTLCENIRALRKQRGLTQEKLAEALGVTVGAVYKWESGLSQPELNLLVEIADFFDTSVDALLGYRVQDKRLEAAGERLEAYCQTLDPAALSDAEKLLARYPNNFRVVYGCAGIFLIFGSMRHEEELIRRSLSLYEQALFLLPQNDDAEIGKTGIYGNMAFARFLLGEKEKCLEILKQNNEGGIFNGEIGTYLAGFMKRPEEAAPYLSEALFQSVTTLMETVMAFVFLFRARGDWTSALSILAWGMDLLNGLKGEEKPDYCEKFRAEVLALLAYVQSKSGMQEKAQETLLQAKTTAQRFDAGPDYSLKAARFADGADKTMIFDILGAKASDSVAVLFGLLDDAEILKQWKEISDHEQQ